MLLYISMYIPLHELTPAMECVILSSMNINYVLHIVLRSSKFFGVLIFNFMVRSKENKISSKTLILGFFFTIGVVFFSFKGSSKNEQPTTLFGLTCASLAFFLDGAVSYFQGKTRNKNMPPVSSFCFMQLTNFWCMLASLAFALMNNSLMKGMHILLFHPGVLSIILLLAMFNIIGQFFTFDHINRFGPVSLSLINTIRKICSILLSIVVYNHSMNLPRWIGISVIILVLMVNSFGVQIVKWLNSKLGGGKVKGE